MSIKSPRETLDLFKTCLISRAHLALVIIGPIACSDPLTAVTSRNHIAARSRSSGPPGLSSLSYNVRHFDGGAVTFTSPRSTKIACGCTRQRLSNRACVRKQPITVSRPDNRVSEQSTFTQYWE